MGGGNATKQHNNYTNTSDSHRSIPVLHLLIDIRGIAIRPILNHCSITIAVAALLYSRLVANLPKGNTS